VNCDNEVSFFSYFDNLDNNFFKNKSYKSYYWGDISGITDLLNFRQNWTHIYIPSAICPNPKMALNAVKSFESKNASHDIFESNLTFEVLIKSILDYFKIFSFGLNVKKFHILFKPQKSQLDFWLLFKNEWHESFFGKTAFENSIYLNLFEKILNTSYKKKVGIYLQENQAWEFALISTWNKYGHGKLIGFPHSAVKFWDLRYFYHNCSFNNSSKLKLPCPSIIAVNSAFAYKLFIETGYSSDLLFEVEALRYMSLLSDSLNFSRKNSPCHFRILVIGDYSLNSTLELLRCLLDSLSKINIDCQVLYKPHPNCSNIENFLNEYNILLIEEKLGDILPNCDVVFTSNNTSGAIDASILGLPVITFFDPKYLNMSPFKGSNAIDFVNSSFELSVLLLKLVNKPDLSGHSGETFFNLNNNLLGWNQLLSSCKNKCRNA
jgi:surface carbohydrate biosynthesis protein (TIGR04326 family)